MCRTAKVTLRIANDYAAVIEGQKAGRIHIAGLPATDRRRSRAPS
jgi:phosphonate transport system substrate-binding protein